MTWAHLREQLALLPEYLSAHLVLTVLALGAGIALSVPLSLAAVRWAVLRGPLLTVAGVIQTVPGLALLALMVPLLGGRIGVLPALIALILYSVLPMLRNAVTGMLEVDRATVEAARGIGMTDGQVLLRVRLPLAMPMLIAGIRTSAVWVVGVATLSTPVGATSLGNYIFSGLQTRNMAAVLVGCVSAAALAIALDQLIRLIERSVSSGRRRRAGAVSGAVVLAAAVGLLPALLSGPTVRIGTKTFTEQYVLARLMADRLSEHGMRGEVLESLGSAVVFSALASGEIDVYVDYSGTIWTNEMGREDNPGRERVMEEMREWLQREHGIVLLGSLGFENTYALAMRRTHAERLGVTSVSDLAEHASALSIAGDYEFFARPEWAALRDTYGLTFRNRRSMDSTLMYSAVADGAVDVITAFSTDGRIVAYDLLVLEDPRAAFPPYDAVVLLSGRAAAEGRLSEALGGLVGAIDDQAMRKANMRVDVEGGTRAAAAAVLEEAVAQRGRVR